MEKREEIEIKSHLGCFNLNFLSFFIRKVRINPNFSNEKKGKLRLDQS